MGQTSVGCGRVRFEDRADDAGAADSNSDAGPDAPSLPLCFADDFEDGDAAGWITSGEWTVETDGTNFRMRNNVDSPVGATHPMLAAVTEAIVVFDVDIETASTGDFHLDFMAPGWTDPSNDSKYRVALYAQGSDNTDDNIRRVIAPTNTTLSQTPTVLAGNTLERVSVTFAADHAISISIAGTFHLTSPPDAQLAGPYDIVFDFFRPGSIDNVQVFCGR